MLQIYGVTYDHTVNYGSCFQAYALQTAIEKINTNGEHWKYELIPLGFIKSHHTKRNLKRTLIQFFLWLHRHQFATFEKTHMKYAPVERMSDLPSLNNQADAFVCGSDVIWNNDFNFGESAYYLDFARKYKFSYAASFGKADVNEMDFARLAQYFASFDSISIRESSGAEIIKNLYRNPIHVVVDPVCLLTADEWEKICRRTLAKKKYIFVYSTTPLAELNIKIKRFVAKLEKRTGLKSIWATWPIKNTLKHKRLQIQTPEHWLEQLKDAEYVVTNSFHATMFSLIFHKKFFTVVRGEKDSGVNVRMNDMLKQVSLVDRIYTTIPEVIDTDDIDFDHADRRISALRKEALAFLKDNLEAAYHQKMEMQRMEGK